MSRPAVAIPEKLFFKIGEVCELAGVQAHVLRYWESEFPMLAPQKNRAGQRVYRKRDVEMALRIKELLYEDQYTIAGAKKRLTNELRGGGKLKVVGSEDDGQAGAVGGSEASGVSASSGGSDARGSDARGGSEVRGGSAADVFSSSSTATGDAVTTSPLAPLPVNNAARTGNDRAHDGNVARDGNITRRSAEERQGLKQLASELRELLALLEQQNKGNTK
jgi:DNA-binding transcriptional MerR regulator